MNGPSISEEELDECAREPISFLEHVQSFACLIAVNNDWTIARVSRNICAILDLGGEAENLLGQQLIDHLDSKAVHKMRNRLSYLQGGAGTERVFGLNLFGDDRQFDVALHLSGSHVVIETEPSLVKTDLDAASTVRTMLARLQKSSSDERFLANAARQVRALVGFDRVMIYRFADDGSGEVIAESTTGRHGSFLGLHFPATDIPAQARELYLRNTFRVIADIDAAPVPLLPEANGVVEKLDLSQSIARSVSPVHIEYLQNMGVTASLSISIVVDGQLWGLIACHHYSGPLLPGFVQRTAAELFGQMFSFQLAEREHIARVERQEKAQRAADQLLTKIAGDRSLLSDAEWLFQEMHGALEFDGLATYVNGTCHSAGSVPPVEDIIRLSHILNTSPASQIFATDQLTAMLPHMASDSSDAAGVLSIPISRHPRDYVLLFRDELLQTVDWGGDPAHKATREKPGSRLSPRKSFERFRKVVKGRSAPFTPAEVRVAETFRSTLIEIVLRYSEELSEERRRSTERQDLLIAELNHRVRNILSLIRGLISQTAKTSEDVDGFRDALLGRVQSLARAHDLVSKQNWRPRSFAELLREEMEAYLPAGKRRIEIDGDVIAFKPEAFTVMALVLHELITNSAKYGALSDNGAVEIEVRHSRGEGAHIYWREKGGPPVQAPTRRGFGSTILERTVPFDLKGHAEIRYKLAGLEADFFLPDMHIVRDSLAAKPQVVTGDSAPEELMEPGLLNGKTILIVEDNMIIAIEAESYADDLGAEEVILASALSTAREAIATRKVDLVLLDYNLGDSNSAPFAEELVEAGIPFLFASGYGEALAEEIGGHRPLSVAKPYDRDSLAAGIAKLMSETSRP